MDITVINSDIKCASATAYSNKRIEDDYMIELCSTSLLEVKDFEERSKESFLLAMLVENIQFLNYRDKCTGKKITNCDLNKIYNLK